MNPTTRKLRDLLNDEQPEHFRESDAVLSALVILATIVAALWIAAVIAYWITK